MHIVLIHQIYVSPEETGGTRHYELAKFLEKNGHDVTVVASRLSYLTGTRTGEKTDGKGSGNPKKGLRVERCYTFPSIHKSFFWRVISFLSFMISAIPTAMKARDADIVMGTSPPIFQCISAWITAVLLNKPFLLEIRDLWPDFAVDIGVLKNPILISLSKMLEMFLYRKADHIVVNSPAYRDNLMEKGVPGEKITLVPNGVDPTMFRSDDKRDSVREKFGLNRHFVVTYAGALGLANDIPTILRAAGRLLDRNEIRFLLVGDGKERPEMERIAREKGLTNVYFTGGRPKAEMPGILAASDACMATLKDIPMFSMTYPNKVFDYMASGRPIILAIDGVIRKVVEAAPGGIFVPPGDDKRLAEAVLKMKEDPVWAKSLGEAGRRYVADHFNRTEQAEKFQAVLVRMLKKERAT